MGEFDTDEEDEEPTQPVEPFRHVRISANQIFFLNSSHRLTKKFYKQGAPALSSHT